MQVRQRKKALQLLALYEGAGNLFWIDAKAPNEWKGVPLGGSAVSLAQLNAAKTLFSHDQLVASNSDNELLRLLAFPIFLPPAVGDIKDIKKLGGLKASPMPPVPHGLAPKGARLQVVAGL